MKSFVLLKNYYHNKNYDKLDSKLEKLSLDRPGNHESQKKILQVIPVIYFPRYEWFLMQKYFTYKVSDMNTLVDSL